MNGKPPWIPITSTVQRFQCLTKVISSRHFYIMPNLQLKVADTWKLKESSHGKNTLAMSTSCRHTCTQTHCFTQPPYVLSPSLPSPLGGMLTEPKWHQRGDGEEHKGTGDSDWNQATGLGTGGVDGCLIWQAVALWHVSEMRDWKHQNRGNWEAGK